MNPKVLSWTWKIAKCIQINVLFKKRRKKKKKKITWIFTLLIFEFQCFFFFHSIFFFSIHFLSFFKCSNLFFFEFFSFGTNVALLLAQLVNALSWETAGRRFKSKKTTLFHQKQAKPIQSINISNSPYTSLQNIIFNMSSLLFIIYIWIHTV